MPIKLLDNTLFIAPTEGYERTHSSPIVSAEKENPPFSVELEILSKQQSDSIKFIKELNGRTIGELNNTNKEQGKSSILVWPHSFKEGKDDIETMTILNCRMSSDGKKIEELRTGNLAGFIGNGKIQIEINSRFSSGEEKFSSGKVKEKQDYFLYYMLSKAFHTNIVNMEVGAGSLKQLNLMLFIFPRLLKEALTQGVFKQYVKREYNDCNVRGTIDINRHIRRNYPANGRVAYNTREFSYDNNITQLIRHTIECVSTKPMGRAILNGDKDTEACVRTIMQVTPAYSKKARLQVIADNNRPLTHPYFTKYKALQQICLAILRNELISHGTQNNKVHGVLIDIAWLWEEYIAEVLRDSGFRHHTRKNGFKLFAKEDKRFQYVIPDYTYESNGSTAKAIADAKYIPLHRYDKLDAERAAAVYYKTIMYMYRFATSKGFLFHPCCQQEAEKLKNDNILENQVNTLLCDYKIGNSLDCHIYEIALVIPGCDSFEKFKEEMEERENCFREKVISCLNNNTQKSNN